MTRYELLDRIGVGGMAEIFRGKAVAAGGFEKPVAIKRILPHLSQDPRFVELLIAEAKVLSLLKHRNIVQIFDVGLGDDNKYFLVMEHVDGKDLGAIQRGLESRRAKIAFDLALHVVAEICEALEHAHTARAPDGKPMSLVHRDISPSNVLLSRAGEVKLTDFGIAKRAEQEHTSSGGVRGKFAYISPEQARNEQISPKSDVFAVGILLWELLANRRLFSGLGDLEALRAVREATVQPPSEVDPRIRTEADSIVMAALSRDPGRRPTAGQLGQQLRSLRYSLDDTSGDPATELAKVIETAEQVARESRQMDAAQSSSSANRPSGFDSMDPGEMTVIRIRTADAFSERNDQSLSIARSVIDRFEEEETRMAQLSAEQLAKLRSGQRSRGDSDSGEHPTVTPPRPSERSRRNTDEPTLMRPPMPVPTDESPTLNPDSSPPNLHYEPDENTRLVAPRDRRTPMPIAAARGPQSAPQSQRQPAGAPSGSGRSQPQAPGPSSGSGRAQPPGPASTSGRAQKAPPRPEPDMMAVAPTLPVGQLIQPFPQPQQQMPMQPPPQGYPQMQMQMQPPPQGYPPQGYPPPQMQPQGYPPQLQPQGYPPQMQPQGYPPQMQPQGYPQQWNGAPQNIASDRAPRQATPTAPDAFERPVYPEQRPQGPPVSGFGTAQQRPAALRPWMLVVGALIMAGLAFALTRAFIH